MTLQELQVTIIADDVTGCLDAAAPFARSGAETIALIRREKFKSTIAPVVAVCTNSRADRPEDAAAKIDSVCQAIRCVEATRLFKKIDSTGKGNLGAEIGAILQSLPVSVAVVCSAFPAQGRSLVDGVVHVQDQPACDLDLCSVITAQTALPVKKLATDRLEQVTSEKSTISEESTGDEPLQGNKEIWLVDASSDEQLDRVAELVCRLGPRAIGVGSSGLARMLAPRWIESNREEADQEIWERPPGFFLALIGSSNDVTTHQVAQLYHEWGGTRRTLGQPVDSAHPFHAELPNLVVNRWDPDRYQSLEDVLNWVRKSTPGTVLLSGGDTAQFVLHAARTCRVHLKGEVTFGIPWGTALDGDLQGCHLVTKAGGFGSTDALSRVYAPRKTSNGSTS